MDYKAVIFDFDLTLADSSKGILICFKHTLEHFGYPVPDDVTIYNTIGLTLIDAFGILADSPDDERREEMRKVYVSKADDVMSRNTFFYDGAVEMLEGLRRDGIKVGVCSTKYRYRISESFEMQVGRMPVDAVIGGEDVKAAKPDPSGLLCCIERLGIGKSETLYVGDNVVDALAAQNAGVDFAAVLSGSTTREEFEKFPHAAICERITDIKGLVYKR